MARGCWLRTLSSGGRPLAVPGRSRCRRLPRTIHFPGIQGGSSSFNGQDLAAELRLAGAPFASITERFA